jgi:ABC-2 type transport system ATP-binding protein
MLQIKDIQVRYRDTVALDHFSAEIPERQITILAGPDGAGKSSLIRMIIGLSPRTQGRLYWQGQEIDTDFRPITRVVGYMPERFSLYSDLSVFENLQFFGRIHGLSQKAIAQRSHELLDRTGMLPFTTRRAGQLSGGMKQKLALSCILLAAPELILLDEPTTGVDPLSRIEFFSIIEALRDEGKTILLATPYLDEAERGDRVIFIKKGRKLSEGRIDELKDRFPAKLWDILPRGSGFELMKNMAGDDHYRLRLYQRGQVIKFLQTDAKRGPQAIQSRGYSPALPTLEDIYLYQDRLGMKELTNE